MSEPTRAVVVTGAASGIGRALAEELGRRQIPVVLCDVDRAGLEAVCGEIKGPAWAVFLLSPESSYCTGARFTADGGFTLGIPHYR